MFELPETRILVCGGRRYGIDQYSRFQDNYAVRDTFRLLDEVHALIRIGTLIHGAGVGADSLAGSWAMQRCVICIAWPADWIKHGNAAGPIRNGEMLHAEPQLVIALPGGDGTRDMIRQAERAGVPVYRHSQGSKFVLPDSFVGKHKPS